MNATAAVAPLFAAAVYGVAAATVALLVRARAGPRPVNMALFVVEEVLQDGPALKVLGRFPGDEGQSLLVLNSAPFAAETAQEAVRSLRLTQTHENDVYSMHNASHSEGTHRSNVTLIRPCSKRHITKHTPQEQRIISETAADYRAVVEPFLVAQDPSRLQWVRNILSGESEAESVLLAHEHFVLLPDTKWQVGNALQQLYLLAIARDGSLRTVRDLRGHHVPMLRALRDESLAEIERRFGVDAACMRVFFHYHPTYYHLHVHFAHIKCSTANAGVARAVLLDDVIDWLESDSEYFSKATLRWVAGERANYGIVGAYEAAGVKIFSQK